MKALILSDIHVDTHFAYAVKPSRIKDDDPKEDVVIDTLEYLWKFYSIPATDALILAGDYANDFLTFQRTIPWLAAKYKEVYLVLGNHDMIIRGGTPSKANLQFTSSEQKLQLSKDICGKFTNVHLLEGDAINGIAGCMGMCDFQCEPPYLSNKFILWQRKWFDGKHWRYFNQVPQAIWAHYDKMLMDIVQKKPKVVITHFVPYELGVSFEFRNDPWNYVFYFNAEKFLEELDDNTYWICGHVHGRRMADYVNSKGNKIHIMCNPLGYPGDRHSTYCDVLDYTGDTLQRTSMTCSDNDFIIDI